MLKNKPHLVKFNHCIVVSLWTFQPTFVYHTAHNTQETGQWTHKSPADDEEDAESADGCKQDDRQVQVVCAHQEGDIRVQVDVHGLDHPRQPQPQKHVHAIAPCKREQAENRYVGENN